MFINYTAFLHLHTCGLHTVTLSRSGHQSQKSIPCMNVNMYLNSEIFFGNQELMEAPHTEELVHTHIQWCID